jgi:ribonuclease III
MVINIKKTNNQQNNQFINNEKNNFYKNEIFIENEGNKPSIEIIIIKQELHNPKNILFKESDLKNIFKKAGLDDYKYQPKKFHLYQQVFVNKSYSEDRLKKPQKYVEEYDDPSTDVSKCIPIQKESNERLEWLGDGQIQATVSAYLFERYSKHNNIDEGFYTKNRSKLVKTDALAKYSEYLGLNKFLLINKYLEDFCNGRNNPKFLEDCFEAFVGALYLDSYKRFGTNIVCKFIINILEATINFPILTIYDDNYKDILMRYYQKAFLGAVPTYGDIKVEEIGDSEDDSKPKKKIFTMCVYDTTKKIIGYGTAKSKKEAEQLAAKEGCKYFNIKVFDTQSYYIN